MAIRVTLEYGHASMVRSHLTPEGYTHDWEVFVRGVDNADIHQYVDKGTLRTLRSLAFPDCRGDHVVDACASGKTTTCL